MWKEKATEKNKKGPSKTNIVAKYHSREKRIMTEINRITQVPMKNFTEHSKLAFELLDSFPQEQIARIYPHKFICEDRCEFAYDGNLFYVDKSHFSAFTSKQVYDEVVRIIREKQWVN